MNKMIFFKPQVGVAADFIPYYEDGKFYLYYLHDYRNIDEYGEGTPWNLLITEDFINFEEVNCVIERGDSKEQDLYIFTGCVYKESEKNYHLFYTGHNPHLRKIGKKEQAVMHAVSSDLINWTKLPEHTFYAPEEGYEEHDWRDPFVFFDNKSNQYKMLLAARNSSGHSIRRGLTVVCSSDNLYDWSNVEPFWNPGLYYTHECPDLFCIGDWYYMIFSEFTDRCMTRYVMSKDLKNWITPENDVFDGRAFYAAKSASNGDKRYLFGWIPTKNKNHDEEHWQWGGNLVVHEIYQKDNMELGVKMPETVVKTFELYKDLKDISIDSSKKYSHILFKDYKYNQGMISFKFKENQSSKQFGLLVNYDEEKDLGYAFDFNTAINQLTFNSQPNTPWNFTNFHNVWCFYKPREEHELRVIFEDNICVAYLDDELVLSTRYYNDSGCFGLYSKNGEISFNDVMLFKRKDEIL